MAALSLKVEALQESVRKARSNRKVSINSVHSHAEMIHPTHPRRFLKQQLVFVWLETQVKILSPFWAKKLEAKNAAKKQGKLPQKGDNLQELPNLKALTAPVPNRSTQRAMHQYRKSNCFRHAHTRAETVVAQTHYFPASGTPTKRAHTERCHGMSHSEKLSRLSCSTTCSSIG